MFSEKRTIHFNFYLCVFFGEFFLTGSGFMEVIEAKNFMMVGSLWRVESGNNCSVNKVSWECDTGVG